MNDIARGQQRRRRGLPAAGIIATAFLAVLAAGCGGSHSAAGSGDSSNTGSSSTSSSAVGYSACMRSHGVLRFPDPDSSGHLPKADPQHLGVSSSQLQAARQACQHLLPNSGGAINADSIQECMMAGDCPRVLVRQVLDDERRFAQCMRSHGVPNWPDPSIDPQGRPVFAISISELGFDPYSRQIWAKGNRART
jgi:hypothetical protein